MAAIISMFKVSSRSSNQNHYRICERLFFDPPKQQLLISIDWSLRLLGLPLLISWKKRDTASLNWVHSGDSHWARQKSLKRFILLLFFDCSRVEWISLNFPDTCNDRSAEWTVLIIFEPWLDAVLVEKVFIGVARHSYNWIILGKGLTADETFLERWIKVSSIPSLRILRQIHSELLPWPRQRLHVALALRADGLQAAQNVLPHVILQFFADLVRLV